MFSASFLFFSSGQQPIWMFPIFGVASKNATHSNDTATKTVGKYSTATVGKESTATGAIIETAFRSADECKWLTLARLDKMIRLVEDIMTMKFGLQLFEITFVSGGAATETWKKAKHFSSSRKKHVRLNDAFQSSLSQTRL